MIDRQEFIKRIASAMLRGHRKFVYGQSVTLVDCVLHAERVAAASSGLFRDDVVDLE